LKSTDLTAGIVVAIGGSPLDPTLLGQLMETRVETTTGLPDVCTLRFSEADAAGSADLKIIDSPKFALGAPLSVKLASPVGTGGPKPVFDGEITTVEAEFGARPGGAPVLELIVIGHDRSHRMHRKTTTRTFRQVTVTDVAKKIAQEHGLKVGRIAPIGGEPAEVLHQVGETDWAFLSSQVAGHGGELDIAAGALSVVDPTKAVAEVAELIYGETLARGCRPSAKSRRSRSTAGIRRARRRSSSPRSRRPPPASRRASSRARSPARPPSSSRHLSRVRAMRRAPPRVSRSVSATSASRARRSRPETHSCWPANT